MDVFLSHNSRDKPIVEKIAERLDDDGYGIWFDKWNLVPGDPWQEELEKALEAASCVVVFLGKELGPWHHEELRVALEDRVREKVRVVPVLLPGAIQPAKTEIPRFLRRLCWVPFPDVDDPHAYHLLRCGIDGRPPGRQKKSRGVIPKKEDQALDTCAPSKSKHSKNRVWEDQIKGNEMQGPGVTHPSHQCKTLTWLHLADLGFTKAKDWEQQRIFQSLQDDLLPKLKDDDLWPDMVFFAGDLTSSGKKEDYRSALSFLKGLAEKLGHNPAEHWFLVPGDRDVDRSSIDLFEKKYRDSLHDPDVAATMDRPESWQRFSKRQMPFLKFTGNLLGKDRAWTPKAPWQTHLFQKQDFRVGVVQLNSSWTSQEDEEQGKLWLGPYQVDAALKAARAQKPHLTLGMLHHNLADLNDGEDCGGMLLGTEGCQFLFGSRKGAKAIQFEGGPGGSCVSMAAGQTGNMDKPYSVLAVQLDLATAMGTVSAYTYTKQNGGFWALDHHLYRDMSEGRWTFPLSAAQEGQLSLSPTDQPEDSEQGFLGTTVPEAYATYMKARFTELDSHMKVEKAGAFRLKKVYVPMKTDWTESKEQETSKKSGDRGFFEGEVIGHKQSQSRPLADLLNHENERHFVLSGAPGSGKSTFCQFQVIDLFTRNTTCLPLLLPLKDFGTWVGSRNGVNSSLFSTWMGTLFGDYGLDENGIAARVKYREVVFFLDGLDEIFNSKDLYRVADILGKWMHREDIRNHHVIITSRPHALTSEMVGVLCLQDRIARLLPLDRDLQKAFLDKWFEALSDSDTHHLVVPKRKRLWQDLERKLVKEVIRSNPLMLSAVATIYYKGKELPANRKDLYDQLVDLLLCRRFGSNSPDGEGSEEKVARLGWGLERVARTMMTSEQVREIDEDSFRRILGQGYHPRVDDLSDIENQEMLALSRLLGAHSGLLELDGSSRKYRFLHFSFQEYLCGRKIGRMDNPVCELEPYLDQSIWNEVVLFIAGELNTDPEKGFQFVNGLWERIDQGENPANRMTLALNVAFEAPKAVVGSKLLQKMGERALEVFEDREISSFSEKERMEIGLALGKLGDPRLGWEKHENWIEFQPGSFTMGSSELKFPKEHDFVNQSAKPPHKVNLSRGFYLAKFPVTNGEFKRFVEGGGYKNEDWWSPEGWAWQNAKGDALTAWLKDRDYPKQYWEDATPGREPRFWLDEAFNGNNQPVVGVSWYEAEAYCNWLTKEQFKQKKGWWPEGAVVSLPTEAQWEMAARGEGNRHYAWGDEEPSERVANFGNRLEKTSPVGMYPVGSTPEGLLDLCGNVWEWCTDPWEENAYKKRKAGVNDPVGKGDGSQRALRGGAWSSPSRDLPAAVRDWFGAGYRILITGFRCCLSVSAERV